jgi:hypothetical protein
MNKAALISRLGIATVTLALLCAYPVSASAQEQPRSPAQGAPPIPETATEAQGFIGEPDFITRAVIFGDRHFGNGDRTNGFYIDSFNMITGAGWIAAGPGYRRWMKQDAMFADASASISWRGYKTAQARFELPRFANSRLALGTAFRWQDYGQVAYYGEGAESLSTNVSEYRLKSTNLVGYATLRPARWIDIGLEAGILNPSIGPRSGSFLRADRPDTRFRFPGDIVFSMAEQPSFLHGQVSATADTRDFPGHPTRGGLYRAAMSNFSDRDTGVFSFKRYETEVAQFIPVADSRVVFALHGWLAASDTGDGQFVPFYLQPSIGGHNTLRGYADYRFHDRNLLLLNAEARIAMMTHVDTAVFWDAGNVAPRFGDLNLDKRSWGVGLRLHSRRQTFARFDVARSDEGWRAIFRLTDPLHLSRLTRRTAPVPFVP